MLGLNKKNNKKKIIQNKVLLLTVLLLIISATSCAIISEDVKEINIDAKVSCDISVPQYKKGTPVFLSIPLFRLCSADKILENINAEGYIVGENAFLEGENVEKLNGMQISVVQNPLSEIVDDSNLYKEQIFDALKNRYNIELKEEKDIKASDKFIDSCIASTYITTIVMTFDDTIDADVKVNKLSIPDIELDFDIDNFEIHMINDYDITEIDSGDIFDYTTVNGCFVNSVPSKAGYYNLNGTAKTNINKVQLISLNKDVLVLKENELSEKNIDRDNSIDNSSLLSDIKRNTSVESDMWYWFKKYNKDIDIYVASLALDFIDEDGRHISKLIYQPSYVDGKYLMAKALYRQIFDKKRTF